VIFGMKGVDLFNPMLRRLALVLCVATSRLIAQPAEMKGATATPLPAAPLGQGAWTFQVEAGWAKLPEGKSLGPTHGGVVVDKAGNVYVSSDGPSSVMVFAKDGKYLRSFPPELSGMHGLAIQTEGGKEYIYGAHVTKNRVVKMNLDGSEVWAIGVPEESGLYKKMVDGKPAPGTEKLADYRPTGVVAGPDGRIYVADGYGASVMHEYSPERKWLRVIGAKGKGDGEFMTCHGVALDHRFGGKPLLLVADRANRRLVHLDLEGKFVRTVTTDLRLPCAISILGDFAAVAELEGRVVITDKSGAVVATLGDNPDKEQWAKFRLAPEFWKDGIFIAAHGLSFDAAGNLYVQDWNFAGRLTKLRRVTANAR
jgi:hypothetical protein